MRKTLQRLLFLLRRVRHGALNEKDENARAAAGWRAKVRERLSFLFTEHGARVIESYYRPEKFGLKVVVIEAATLRLRVTSDATLPEEYIESRVAPVHAPTEFQPVQIVWMALEPEQNTALPNQKFRTLPDLAQSLQEIFPKLSEAFSETNYPETKRKIESVDQQLWEHWKEHNPGPKGREQMPSRS